LELRSSLLRQCDLARGDRSEPSVPLGREAVEKIGTKPSRRAGFSSRGNRGFESVSLQRRVTSEPRCTSLFADLFEIAWPFVLKRSAPLSRWAPLFVLLLQ